MADQETKQTEVTVPDHWQHLRTPLVILAAVLIVIVIFAAGLMAGHRAELRGPGFAGMKRPGMIGQFGGRGGGFRDNGLSTNQSRIQGVVTAVNGTSLTVAGDGSTNTVTTNGSTQYVGGSQAAVDDTIVATVTTSNGTFTATRIVINP